MFFCNILYIYCIIKKRTHRMLGTARPVLFSLPVWESRMSCGKDTAIIKIIAFSVRAELRPTLSFG